MHRFYIAPENWDPQGLALRGSEAHHARNVLRMQAGDKLVLFNGEGRELTAEITNVDGRRDSIAEIARIGNAAAALQDCSGTGNPKREKHGPHRAEGRRDWCSRNCTDHFRPHDCAARFRKRLAKTDKMAADRHRSGQAMRPKLAAARSRAEKISGILLQLPSKHSIFG